jgi:hypothetical protein
VLDRLDKYPNLTPACETVSARVTVEQKIKEQREPRREIMSTVAAG